MHSTYSELDISQRPFDRFLPTNKFAGSLGRFSWVVPCYVILLSSLGLTLPAAMTASLTLHRQRAGFAAAVLGAVCFVGGGLVAPLTALADARLCLSVILLVSSVLLVIVSVWLSLRMKLEKARGETLDLGGGEG